MSSPTRSANGGPKSDEPSASRPTTPVTPTKVTTSSRRSSKSNSPKSPTSPMEYFCEEVHLKNVPCPYTIITRGHRESTYFEDNCSANPEEDEEKFTEKLQLIKKQVKINKMKSEVEALAARTEQLQQDADPTNSRLDDLEKQLAKMAAAHDSKKKLIDDILNSADVLKKTGDMSAAEILEVRKAQARITKLQLGTMESEIEVLELKVLVDAERAIFNAKTADLRAAEATLKEMKSAIVELKLDFAKSNAAWIEKYSVDESTSAPADEGTLSKLEQALGKSAALQLNVTELANNVASLKSTAANDTRLLKEQIQELTDAAAFAKATAATETRLLKETVQELTNTATFSKATAAEDNRVLKEQIRVLTEEAALSKVASTPNDVVEGLKTFFEEKIKALEDRIEIMKPIYRLGRFVRYRNNYSTLRKKYEGQNVNVNYDKYEDGHAAYFAGHVLADSTMYHAGFDEEDVMGRDKNNFESLHFGVPAKTVWKLRTDFTILPKILDMATDMKVYTTDDETTDDQFGTIEFKELFEKVFPKIVSTYAIDTPVVLAITSDEQFRKRPDLVATYKAMESMVYDTSSKNLRDRRRGIEESWGQPYEDAWMDFADELYEASRRGMC